MIKVRVISFMIILKNINGKKVTKILYLLFFQIKKKKKKKKKETIKKKNIYTYHSLFFFCIFKKFFN